MLAPTGGLWGPVQHARQPLHEHNIAVKTFDWMILHCWGRCFLFWISNIYLRNITIQNPQFSYGQGVIMGSQVRLDWTLWMWWIFYALCSFWQLFINILLTKQIEYRLHGFSQNLPMTNITFDGVRVLGAESEQKESYHTCTGKYPWWKWNKSKIEIFEMCHTCIGKYP